MLKLLVQCAGACCILWIAVSPYEQGKQSSIEVRVFAPADGIDEDPVCGNGCLAASMRHSGQMHPSEVRSWRHKALRLTGLAYCDLRYVASACT